MYQLKSPFSEAFDETWKMWKEWRKETHHFKYANPISEQAALNELVDLSEGDEDHAKRIVNRSISRNWRGFYKIHNPKKDKVDGKSAKQTTTGRVANADLKVAYSKRYGAGGEQATG